LDREIGYRHWRLICLQQGAGSDMLANVAGEEGCIPNRTERFIEFSLPRVRVHGVADARS
jgi:hypothetical protein